MDSFFSGMAGHNLAEETDEEKRQREMAERREAVS